MTCEMLSRAFIGCLLTLWFATVAVAQGPPENRLVHAAEIDASVEKVWAAFSTTKGLQSWVSKHADIELKVGGKWRANYAEDGKLGDKDTIVNTILAYDPKRMLAIKATGFPDGFAFKEAAQKTWSVIYFESLAENKTKVTMVGLGYDDSEQSKKMKSYFKQANDYSFDQLKAALKEKKVPEDAGKR